MNYLKLLLGSIFILLAVQASAQDKIFKKNGEIIEARVSQITAESIVFKRFDNPDGPEYTISKVEVSKIKYTSGSQDIFEDNNDKIGVDERGKSIGAKKYADRRELTKNKNIIAFAPLQFTENGYGFSFSYERTLDKTGWVSFYCPAILTFSNSTQTDYNTGITTTTTFNHPMFYLMPGVKIYTNLNSFKRSKFSLGPSLVFGFGNGTPSISDIYGNNSVQSRFLMGAIVNAGGNIFPSPHLYVGYDFGLGLSYINTYNNVGNGTTALVQTSFRIGYKFTKKSY